MRGARLIYAKHGRGSYCLSLPVTSAITQRLLRVQGGHRRSLRDGQRGRVPLRGGDAGGRRDRRDSFCVHPQVGLVQAHPEQPGGLHQEGKLVRTSLSRDRTGPGVTLAPPPPDLLLLAVSGDGGLRVVRRPAAVPGGSDGGQGDDGLPELQHLPHPLEGEGGSKVPTV